MTLLGPDARAERPPIRWNAFGLLRFRWESIDKILLLRKPQHGSDFLSILGGGDEPGEKDPISTVIREILEEANLDLRAIVPGKERDFTLAAERRASNYDWERSGRWHTQYLYARTLRLPPPEGADLKGSTGEIGELVDYAGFAQRADLLESHKKWLNRPDVLSSVERALAA